MLSSRHAAVTVHTVSFGFGTNLWVLSFSLTVSRVPAALHVPTEWGSDPASDRTLSAQAGQVVVVMKTHLFWFLPKRSSKAQTGPSLSISWKQKKQHQHH